jgi:hypothetical protein
VSAAVRTTTVKAWSAQEGDLSPFGARVISVIRDPSVGKVRLGYSDGNSYTVSGERSIVVVQQPRQHPAIFVNAARRAREFWHR